MVLGYTSPSTCPQAADAVRPTRIELGTISRFLVRLFSWRRLFGRRGRQLNCTDDCHDAARLTTEWQNEDNTEPVTLTSQPSELGHYFGDATMIRLSTAVPVLLVSLTVGGIAMGNPKAGGGSGRGGQRPPVVTNGSSGYRPPVATPGMGGYIRPSSGPSNGVYRPGWGTGGRSGGSQKFYRGTFKYGHFYSGRGNRFWNQTRWWSKHRCKCYWCPSTRCWYYWCNNASCYYPVDYVEVEPPTTEDDTPPPLPD